MPMTSQHVNPLPRVPLEYGRGPLTTRHYPYIEASEHWPVSSSGLASPKRSLLCVENDHHGRY